MRSNAQDVNGPYCTVAVSLSDTLHYLLAYPAILRMEIGGRCL